jgi:mono/diheme cytochrome c family protein
MVLRAACAAFLVLAFASPALASVGPAAGKIVFKAQCGKCHTLAAAGTVGKGANVGPVLTNRSEKLLRVLKKLAGQGAGLMPSYLGVLTQKQMNDVAAFVVNASVPGAK